MNEIIVKVDSLLHSNINDEDILDIKSRIDKLYLYELIILDVELLYLNQENSYVSNLVHYTNSKINITIRNINLYELGNTISILKTIVNNQELIMESENKIKSINLWINNLDSSFDRKLKVVKINELIESYLNILVYINKNNYINEYIYKISSKIENTFLSSKLFDSITDIMPILSEIYNNRFNINDKTYKVLDYYIDFLNNSIKHRISLLTYHEKLVLKDKINSICYDILHNNDSDDDFKVLIIKNYLRYL